MSNEAGVLSIRLIAGRKIKAAIPGSLLRWQSECSNPYCTIRFGSETWKSSVVKNSLQPNWKRDEQCHFVVPLPSETLSTSSMKNISPSEYLYDPQHPSIEVQIWHESDPCCLIGSCLYSILPVITSPSSSTKEWIQVYDINNECTGQVLLSFHYDPSGKDPEPGDLIRLANFGGFERYNKLVDQQTRLRVVDVQADRVLAMYKSTEGWKVQLDLPRNFIHVVHRQATAAAHSFHRITQTNVLDQLTFLPEQRRHQLNQVAKTGQLVGTRVWKYSCEAYSTYQLQGMSQMIQSSKEEGREMLSELKNDIFNMNWTGQVNVEEEKQAEAVVCQENDEDDDDDDECPAQLICPITGCRMKDPVVAADGHSYDRQAILQWFASHQTSPMTGAPVPTIQVFDNYALKKLLQTD